MARDQIYSLPRQHVGDFTFDSTVAEVFPDMIARSVPGYASIMSMTEQLAARFIQPHSNVYDLGCSLGTASFLMQHHAPATATIHAIDNSAAMLEKLQESLNQTAKDNSDHDRCAILAYQADIQHAKITNASFVVLNWTLQFIPGSERTDLLCAIFQGLNPGGALLLSEKICFEEPGQQTLLTDLHHDFKRAHGYSELEIAQKRTALENRMVPETLSTHVSRLESVGFSIVAPWFQCFNFASILAVKAESPK